MGLAPTTLPPSTLCAAGFLANRPLRQVNAKVEKTIAGCGLSSPVSLASFDPGTLSWRTCQDCSPSTKGEPSETFSARWPRSGMMRGGTVSELPTSGRLIGERGCSSSRGAWPTPTQMDTRPAMTPEQMAQRQARQAAKGQACQYPLSVAVRAWPTPRASECHQGALNPAWVEECVMGFPAGWTDLGDGEAGPRAPARSKPRGSLPGSPAPAATEPPASGASATPSSRKSPR